VKALRSIRKLDLGDVVLGQLKDESNKDESYMKSLTPTFFAAALYIENARWDGVPFLIKTGMGLMKNRYDIWILWSGSCKTLQFFTSLVFLLASKNIVVF
jgi:glucose-6-phosphate 1-dehydrogenase